MTKKQHEEAVYTNRTYPVIPTIKLLVLAVIFSTLRAAAQFEGIVESTNRTTDELGKPQRFVMTMWIKKNMVKIETRGADQPVSTMIYRTDQKKIYMVNHEEKTYFEIPQDEKAQEVYGAGGTTAKYNVKRTGKTKNIAGYPCEQFIIKRETEETQLWGTKKLGHLVTAITQALGQEHAEAAEGATEEVMKMGYFPMSSVTKLEGILVEAQEVTKIETGKMDQSVFALPAGYKKQKGIEMMPGMQPTR